MCGAGTMVHAEVSVRHGLHCRPVSQCIRPETSRLRSSDQAKGIGHYVAYAAATVSGLQFCQHLLTLLQRQLIKSSQKLLQLLFINSRKTGWKRSAALCAFDL